MADQPFVAKTFSGLEEVLQNELIALGAENVKLGRRAVMFEGDNKLLYRANYELRTAINILKPIGSFQARTDQELYDGVMNIDWSQYLHTRKRFMISGSVMSDFFKHSQFATLRTKDAIVDQFNEKYGKRPSVERKKPEITIDLNIRNEKVTLSLNSSGFPLFKRGYREEFGQAPLNEVLASGLIQLSGWDKKSPLVDPMCGAGTIPIEAAMLACNVPAGYKRPFFSFTKWMDFDEDLWEQVKEEAHSRITPLIASIRGSDVSIKMIRKSRMNAQPFEDLFRINFTTQNLNEMLTPREGTTVIMNPPYGERMAEMEGFREYRDLGDFMKQNLAGSTVWILTSDKQRIKHIGLKTSRKINLFNGALECTYRRFDLY